MNHCRINTKDSKNSKITKPSLMTRTIFVTLVFLESFMLNGTAPHAQIGLISLIDRALSVVALREHGSDAPGTEIQ